MTKTPEELTEEWKAGKLKQGWYFTLTVKGEVCPNLWFDDEWNDFMGMVEEVLAPCSYNEYKAMQEELAEFKRSVTSYIGKPIDYDIACETVNKLLDDKEQLKKELKSARWYQTIMNEDIAELRALLKECLPIVSAEIMTWQIRGGEESRKRGQDLLTRINAVLGCNETQANPVDSIKIQESEE